MSDPDRDPPALRDRAEAAEQQGQALETRVVDSQYDPPSARPLATAAGNQPVPTKPRRIWVMECPFRKTGSPVLGTFGANIQPVVIFTMAEWKRLCADVPALQTTQFEVGSWE